MKLPLPSPPFPLPMYKFCFDEMWLLFEQNARHTLEICQHYYSSWVQWGEVEIWHHPELQKYEEKTFISLPNSKIYGGLNPGFLGLDLMA